MGYGWRIQLSSGTQFEHEECCGKTLNVGKKMVAMFDNFLGGIGCFLSTLEYQNEFVLMQNL
jgi:hypothetical protein